MFPHFEQMKDAMLLRNSLAPYIYTAARQHYDTGIGLLRPLYYEHPEQDEAYEWATTQYYFGDSILCAPIATPASSPDQRKGKSTKTLWVPAGAWVEWDGEVTHVGPALLSKNYSLAEIPMLVSAGSVVPLKTMASVAALRPDPLVWAIFVPGVGANDCREQQVVGKAEVYEDDGETREYETSQGERTVLEYSGDWTATVMVNITSLYTPGTPAHEIRTSKERGHALQLRGLQQRQGHKLKAVSFRVGGMEADGSRLAMLADTSQPVEDRLASAGWWTHTGHSLSTPRHSVIVNLGQHPTTKPIEVRLDFEV